MSKALIKQGLRMTVNSNFDICFIANLFINSPLLSSSLINFRTDSNFHLIQ